MKRVLFWLIAAAMVASVVASVFAGGHECAASMEDCAKKMYTKYQQSAWLGIEKEKGPDGSVRISAVIPGSPAAAAGFAVGDELVAINGVNLADLKKKEVKSKETKAKLAMEPGSRVTYTVRRASSTLNLTATLEKPPESVIAQWIGEHIIKEPLPQTVASS